jgi:putative flippase GtrA
MATLEPIPAPPDLAAPRARRSRLWAVIGRHQIASLISTAVDFGVMVLGVELFGLRPALATLLGAVSGGVTNFQLGRHWIFEARHEGAGGQALRYALVSGTSAALNAAGEYGAHDLLRIDYLAARAMVAVAVSLLWNFPMHRHFVFREPPPRGEAST